VAPVASFKPGLVIFDVRMPDGGGVARHRRVREGPARDPAGLIFTGDRSGMPQVGGMRQTSRGDSLEAVHRVGSGCAVGADRACKGARGRRPLKSHSSRSRGCPVCEVDDWHVIVGAFRWTRRSDCARRRRRLDSVHSVHKDGVMSTAYVSGRVPTRYERLVAKQARAARTSKSDLVARYVIEKSFETEFPGISFRDSVSGREAYLTGHRVAVWEVSRGAWGDQVHREDGESFRLDARACQASSGPTRRRSGKKSADRVKEESTQYRLPADENTSHRLIFACRRLVERFPIVHIAKWHGGSWLGDAYPVSDTSRPSW
jgi:hypothetical protein